MAKYRKKPLVIDAIQWNGHNLDEIAELIGAERSGDGYVDLSAHGPLRIIYVRTAQGVTVSARTGEWIVPEDQPGRAYPIAPDVFRATYEAV